MHGYTIVSRVPVATDVVGDHRIIDDDIAGMIVGYEEDRRSMLVDLVVRDPCAQNGQGHGVAVVVDRSPAAAAGRAGLRRIGPIPDGAVVGEEAVDDGP